MTIIVNSVIVSDRPQSGGLRKILEHHTDTQGEVHAIRYVCAADHDADAALISHASDLESSVPAREFDDYLNKIRARLNPFRNAQGDLVDPKYSTRNDMLRKVLKHVFSRKERSEITELMFAARFLQNVTDVQLKTLLGISDAKVAEIRTKQAMLESVIDNLDTYTPPLEEES